MTREAEWTGPLVPDLDELAAFDAMRAFLKDYWEIGLKQEEEIAILLSSLQRAVWADGQPADPAMWSDWRKVPGQGRQGPALLRV